jgi:ribosomal protein S27AE
MGVSDKKCFKCLAIKPLTDFYKHPQMADGRVNKCKECNRRDVRENRAEKIDYYIEYDRARAMSPDRVASKKKYLKTEGGKLATARAKKKWLDENTIKRAAQIMVGNAVRDGRLKKEKTCKCGNTGRIHGHHDDYSKPLSVRWLCPKCHTEWHKNNKPING